MIRTATAGMWGITGAQFLWIYGFLSAVVAGIAWRRWRDTIGPIARGNDPMPDLGLYRLAMLGGGRQLAITTAATKLHRDGLLVDGDTAGTLVVRGALPAGSDPLERALFEAVRREPGISIGALRRELQDGDVLAAMQAKLVESGLLIDESRRRALRRMWLLGAALAALGAARIAAGPADGYLVALVCLVVAATGWLLMHRPSATSRGRAAIRRVRSERQDLRRHPVESESAQTVALFGGDALWKTDPAIASTLRVPRESGMRWYAGSGGGACSVGGAGCGGGGIFDGGGGGSGGGGGCGGGGCGGGGS